MGEFLLKENTAVIGCIFPEFEVKRYQRYAYGTDRDNFSRGAIQVMQLVSMKRERCR